MEESEICFVEGMARLLSRPTRLYVGKSGRQWVKWKVRRRRTVSMGVGGLENVDVGVVASAARTVGVKVLKFTFSLPRLMLEAIKYMLGVFDSGAGIATSFLNELERLRRLQPVDPAAAARPELFPTGFKLMLIWFVGTYVAIRFLTFLTNLVRFGFAVLWSTVQSLSDERPMFRFLRKVINPLSSATFVQSGDNESLFQNSGDFRAREMTDQEPAEWVNAAVRKVWRLYPKDLSKMAKELMQESIDENLLENKPPFVDKISVESVEMGERPFWVRNVEKLPTRIDSHLAYNFNFRYTGDANFVMKVSLTGPFRRFGVNVPVLVGDMNIDAKAWVRAKLTREAPYLYEISWALAEKPNLDVVIKPFKAVNLMTVPGLSKFLRNLLITELPSQFILPAKSIMYLDPTIADVNAFAADLHQTDAQYKGLLAIILIEAKELSGQTSMGLKNPFCYIRLNDKVIKSKNDTTTSEQGGGTAPIWNQQFELLVRDPKNDVLEIEVHNRFGALSRPVGSFRMRLGSLQEGKKTDLWVPLRGGVSDKARLHLNLNYRKFVDDSDNEHYFKTRAETRRKIEKKQRVPKKAGHTDKAVQTVDTVGFPEGPIFGEEPVGERWEWGETQVPANPEKLREAELRVDENENGAETRTDLGKFSNWISSVRDGIVPGNRAVEDAAPIEDEPEQTIVSEPQKSFEPPKNLDNERTPQVNSGRSPIVVTAVQSVFSGVVDFFRRPRGDAKTKSDDEKRSSTEVEKKSDEDEVPEKETIEQIDAVEQTSEPDLKQQPEKKFSWFPFFSNQQDVAEMEAEDKGLSKGTTEGGRRDDATYLYADPQPNTELPPPAESAAEPVKGSDNSKTEIMKSILTDLVERQQTRVIRSGTSVSPDDADQNRGTSENDGYTKSSKTIENQGNGSVGDGGKATEMNGSKPRANSKSGSEPESGADPDETSNANRSSRPGPWNTTGVQKEERLEQPEKSTNNSSGKPESGTIRIERLRISEKTPLDADATVDIDSGTISAESDQSSKSAKEA
uniref:C2 domain-containing protein n=1 Tax=Rhodosorus marinus TaxID=101924 RepID=A0A7S2ZFI3_9RHOD|mmetsp:Transcript_1777/g.6669  ORF Transcript_1777/g.6669 Transcript_1777/m.6669 type:complete len:1022 (+) Transcript_1777:145-3210(+)